MNERLPRVDELIINELARAFAPQSILKRQNLNAEQKIAYMQAIEEVLNYLNTCRDENGL